MIFQYNYFLCKFNGETPYSVENPRQQSKKTSQKFAYNFSGITFDIHSYVWPSVFIHTRTEGYVATA